MFHPLCDTSKLTEKELFDKIDEVSGRIVMMRRMNMNYDVINQAELFLECLNMQLRDAQSKQDFQDNPTTAEFNMEDYLVDVTNPASKGGDDESDNILGW